jgi:hypothetical protein
VGFFSEVLNGHFLLVDLSLAVLVLDVLEVIVILASEQAVLANPRQYPLC